MENKNSLDFINDIIHKWVGDEYKYEEDPVGTYIARYPDSCCVIDILPHIVKDLEKYHQVAVFYQKWVDRHIDGKCFLSYEERYIEFLKTLWLYNRVEMRYNLSFDNFFMKGYPKIRLRNKVLPSECEKTNDMDWGTIEKMISLALREAGFLWLYFQELEMIAVIHDFCIQLLMKDQEAFRSIKPILLNCQLYCHRTQRTVL